MADEKISPQVELELGTTRSVGQCLNPLSYRGYKVLETKHEFAAKRMSWDHLS